MARSKKKEKLRAIILEKVCLYTSVLEECDVFRKDGEANAKQVGRLSKNHYANWVN